MDSGGQTQTTSSSSAPWSGQQPYLTYGFQQAQDLYQNAATPAYFPGQTVASQSPQTQAAIAGTTARAENGSPLNTANSGYLSDVLSGKYLTGNPMQGALNQSISDSVLPTVESQFSGGGRYGSPAMAGTMTTALADAIAPSEYGNYQQERQNQQTASSMAPTAANQDYVDLGQLNAAGQQQDAFNQSNINANIDRYNYGQTGPGSPLGKLQNYLTAVQGGSWGSQGTSTTTQPSGGLLGFLGGLL